MSDKCAKRGCQFRLPATYPLPLCPWHAAPGKGIVKIVSAIGILVAGVGGKYAFDRIRDEIRSRKIRREQTMWRDKARQTGPSFEGVTEAAKTQ
jgi:hypothetical protein